MSAPAAEPTILILSAAMGGGHLQISRELARRLRRRGYRTEVVDVLDRMPAPTGHWLGSVYPMLVNHAPRLYEAVYQAFFQRGGRPGGRVGVPVQLMLPALRRLVRRMRPGLVLSTYPLCSVALGRLRQEGSLACPAVTIVTTFSLNRLWLHPGVDALGCISVDAAVAATRSTGLRADVTGPIVRPGFAGCRAGEGEHSPRTAIVSTGSLGLAGHAAEAAKALAAMSGWRVKMLCGHDAALRRRMSRLPGVEAVGWVQDMPGLLGQADVLVDNAGGMSSKEALVAGLPVVTYRPLAGHGRDDALAMARLGVSELVESPAHLADALGALFCGTRLRTERIRRGRELCQDDPLALITQLCPPGLAQQDPGTAAVVGDSVTESA